MRKCGQFYVWIWICIWNSTSRKCITIQIDFLLSTNDFRFCFHCDFQYNQSSQGSQCNQAIMLITDGTSDTHTEVRLIELLISLSSTNRFDVLPIFRSSNTTIGHIVQCESLHFWSVAALAVATACTASHVRTKGILLRSTMKKMQENASLITLWSWHVRWYCIKPIIPSIGVQCLSAAEVEIWEFITRRNVVWSRLCRRQCSIVVIIPCEWQIYLASSAPTFQSKKLAKWCRNTK